jgi:ubiquinone/menaquinone biosynthesis C-methylase UbiE
MHFGPLYILNKQMSFQDHFSQQSEAYRQGRPAYPAELFEYLVSLAPSHETCWDCATGNGQAAVSLSPYFKKVIATDGSAEQIRNAIKKGNIEYRVATAEESGLAENSIDLVTVATAAHWFNHDRFYAEVRRVIKPGGILAIWAYADPVINNEVDKLMTWFMYDFLLDYWPQDRNYIRTGYETLPFPFNPMETPDFFLKMEWNKQQLLNWAKTWSAYSKYVEKNHTDPLEVLMPRLNTLWRDEETKQMSRKVHLKCARL